jgi:ferrous iron transport protein A
MNLALNLPRFFRTAPSSGGQVSQEQKIGNTGVTESAEAAMSRPDSAAIDAALPLGLVSRGAQVRVVALRDNGRGLEKRLEAMGIRVGTEMEVLQDEGGSVVVRIGESRVALGVAMKHRILVTAGGR